MSNSFRTRAALFAINLLTVATVHGQDTPAPTTSPPITQGLVFEEEVLGHQAICKANGAPLEAVFKEEMASLMLHMAARGIFFSGGPYFLFEMSAANQPTKNWRICVRTRAVEGLPPTLPEPPYAQTTIDTLVGIGTTCPKEPPGPSLCKEALASALTLKGASAIGSPRVTEAVDGLTLKFWVPYKVKQ